MTNKRAIEMLKNELACVSNPDCNREECRNCQLVMPEHEITEALHMAIKALEQESVLNEIRAEIKQLQYQRIFGNVSSYSLLDVVVEIIDKYRKGGSGN